MAKIYQFKEDDAVRFAQMQGIPTRKYGNEMQFIYCPVCKGGKSRDKNTFSISLRTGQCECKRSSCNYRGNMITLAKDFSFELSKDAAAYFNLNRNNDKYKNTEMQKRRLNLQNQLLSIYKAEEYHKKFVNSMRLQQKLTIFLYFHSKMRMVS